MNHPDFTQLRRLIDNAITYNDLDLAKKLASHGLNMSQEMEVLGEQMFFRAQLEIIDDNFDNAIKYLDNAIKYNPTDGAAFNDRALCMIELGRIDGVLRYFDKGIEVEPDYETIYHNKGWFLNKLGQHCEALDLFKKALELDPNRAVTYENIG
ncbi:MAG: tetratricopeptide repeat protein, partial [Candidatus Omnitrophica bacterium]|nr:tetratricopeptide repeat protein [Candidatus Omnitrophota bacterium]